MLWVHELSVRYPGVQALSGVDLAVDSGQVVAVIGESGSGKSTLARAVGGLLSLPGAPTRYRISGRVHLGEGPDLLTDPRAARATWADTLTVAVQGTGLDPVRTLGHAIGEPLRRRRDLSRRERARRVAAIAGDVGLTSAELERHPHEVSGGQARRAVIAAALVLEPRAVFLDEPTAGLDQVTAREVLSAVRELTDRHGIATVVITHSLADADLIADRTCVLYSGRLVETGPTARVLGASRHPYTRALVAAAPVMSTALDLRPLPGPPIDPSDPPTGCAFHPRCPQAESRCTTETTRLTDEDHAVACHLGGVLTRLRAVGVAHTYRGQRRPAVDGIDLTLDAGSALGVVGASGSGKSTLAALLAGHLPSGRGRIEYDGRPLTEGWSSQARAERRRVQLVAQDPWATFSPRGSIRSSLLEALDPDRRSDPDDDLNLVLHSVGLPGGARLLGARPHQVSGGQLQRLNLARALLAEPSILVADEPTSMLDPSEAARFAVLLRELQSRRGLSLVLVTHDLALARKLTHHIVVLDAGRIVDRGPTPQVCERPGHPVTRRLLHAAPRLPPWDAADSKPVPSLPITPV